MQGNTFTREFSAEMDELIAAASRSAEQTQKASAAIPDVDTAEEVEDAKMYEQVASGCCASRGLCICMSEVHERIVSADP